MKGRALRRALQTTDAVRIAGDIPLLTDTTEVITPERAYDLLARNTKNRPINWKRVEMFADAMRRGEWKMHGQGILLDTHGNIITGQHRLWAVIYADRAVPMRVSHGNPPDVAVLVDRHAPQTSRDLASRTTTRKHSPTEATLARATLALRGQLRPSVDELAHEIIRHETMVPALLEATRGTRKSRAVLMILGAICEYSQSSAQAKQLCLSIDQLAEELTKKLLPHTPNQCWGRGAAFGMAMRHADEVVREQYGSHHD